MIPVTCAPRHDRQTARPYLTLSKGIVSAPFAFTTTPSTETIQKFHRPHVHRSTASSPNHKIPTPHQNLPPKRLILILPAHSFHSPFAPIKPSIPPTISMTIPMTISSTRFRHHQNILCFDEYRLGKESDRFRSFGSLGSRTGCFYMAGCARRTGTTIEQQIVCIFVIMDGLLVAVYG